MAKKSKKPARKPAKQARTKAAKKAVKKKAAPKRSSSPANATGKAKPKRSEKPGAADPTRLFLRACFDGDLKAVKTAVEKRGIDVNVANQKGMTPLMSAAWQHDRDEVAAYLISKGASLAPRQPSSSWNAFCFAAVNNGERCLRLFLKSGYRIDEAAGDWKALAFAVQYRSQKTVPILLIHGAAPNRRDPDGITPLIRAVRNSDATMAGMLMGHGADPNLAGPDGWTPLHHACTKANPGLVERLLAAGAKTGLKTDGGKTPAEILTASAAPSGPSKGQLAIAELLKKR